ncbi:MAG TPA: DUF6456 domain-containing protein [Rhizomicrobium sp.]|jgi:hypothetical protein|nr:DUF6456 domain-containing protein [Rhizomicrobium sp.]
MSAPADGEIEREARRVFRKLLLPGAHLRGSGADAWRIVSREEVGPYRSAGIAAATVAAFVRRGWLARGGGAAETLVLSEAGASWYRGVAAADDPFAAQHQLLRTRRIKDAQGVERFVTVDDGESPLARLKARGLIDAAQFDAGEKLRVDFTLARLMPRLGVDLTAPLVTGTRGKKPERLFSDTVLAAKQRFTAAMRAVGPGLGDLLFDVCCHLRGLEEAERMLHWPSRSGRVVLGLALDRLAEHYGMRLRGRAGMRSWAMEGE